MTPKKLTTRTARKSSTESSSATKATTKAAGKTAGKTAGAASSETPQQTVFNKNVRVIKKYPNRRLYDTTTSTYITLMDIKALVMKNVAFVVRDAKTDEDITRSMLLQIILEAEAGGTPMFTEAVLANIIRFYGHAMQSFVGNYLEKNMQTFTDLQTNMSNQSAELTPEGWAQFMQQGVMGGYMQQMKKQTEQMLDMLGLKK